MDRRTFLHSGLAATATGAGLCSATATAATPTTPWVNEAYYRSLVPEVFVNDPAPISHSRNLVIGNGFGGAISALRLAQAGEHVTVLERGFR